MGGKASSCKVEGCERKHKGLGFCEPHYRRLKKYGSPFISTKFQQMPIEYEIDENGCFNCTSHTKNPSGYPTKKVEGLSKMISRIIYEECFGEIPDGQIIRHKCDNPTCINPEHLETGTHQDNMNDKVERGRTYHPIGEKNPKAKITQEEVIQIKNMKQRGFSLSQIAKQYNISSTSVSRIITGKQWGHIQ